MMKRCKRHERLIAMLPAIAAIDNSVREATLSEGLLPEIERCCCTFGPFLKPLSGFLERFNEGEAFTLWAPARA